MDFAFFSMQKLGLFILVFARTAGIFTLTPLFGANQAPIQVRLAVALGMTLVFLPMVNLASTLPTEPFGMLLMVARETVIGLVIGFVTTMVLTAIQVAGQLMDAQSGFAMAGMLDPSQGVPVSVAARFHNLLAGLLFFATNAHHIMIRGLADSFTIAPVGELGLNPLVVGGTIDLFAALFLVAVRIAAPVVAAVFLADIALAITARIVPQMNVLLVGFPLKLGVGMAGMIVALPVIASMSQGLFGDIYQETLGLVKLIAA